MKATAGISSKWLIGLAVVLAAAAASPRGWGQTKIGTTAAQFLGIGVGPRATGMGGAYAASSDDVTSAYWNPGALAQSGRSQLMFSNSQWLVDTKFRWLGIMMSFDENAVGLSLTQLDYGDEEVTTESAPDGNGERWSAQDLSIALSYSRRLTDRFSLGGSAKYISESIWNESANTFTFDLGLLFVTDFNNMRLGVSMSNFGGDLTLDGTDLLKRYNPDDPNSVGKQKVDSWSTPLLFRVGLAMDVVKTGDMKLTLAGDALRPSDNDETVNLGGEIGWHDLLFARAGYKSLFSDNSEEGLALGAGIRYAVQGMGSLEVNYAFSKFGAFDNLNSISVAIAF